MGHQEACPLPARLQAAVELPPKQMTKGSRVGGQALACGYHEAGQGRGRATHEFTLETDELRDTAPRVCLTKLHMQETEQNKVRGQSA